MLFLGAGASRPFGIPPTYKLAEEITNSIPESKSEWKEELSKIRSQLTEIHKDYDIEIILNLLVSRSDSVASRYYESSDLHSDIKVSLSKLKILELINEIKKQIYKRCLEFDKSKAINTYKELYMALHESSYGGRAKFDKQYMERLDNFKITKRVITTNYDPVFETFIRTTQKKYSDGFTIDELGDITFKKHWNAFRSVILVLLIGDPVCSILVIRNESIISCTAGKYCAKYFGCETNVKR
jgi:hypothetical protein